MSLLIRGNLALQGIERAMRSIGYAGDLLQEGYQYTDVITSNELRTIELAGFAQSPPTYRNACIGVVVSNGLAGSASVKRHKALGAPLFFEVNGNVINRWKITAVGEPELKEVISFGEIPNAFSYHKSEWEPDAILRAKAVGEPGSIQLDFYDENLMPFLEGKNFEKLDYVLREVVTKSRRVYRRLAKKAPSFNELFPLTFRFIAAKVFRDRGYSGGWTSDDALVALRAIEKHYNVGSEALPQSEIHDPEILQKMWEIIVALFHFANLSEDDLALIFERTFITPETRKRLGIHSTPPRVAQYVVNKLPFESVPENQRYVFEPFTGHGRFLIAAMRRMRGLLSRRLSSSERHSYFQKHLAGIELDNFSVEVCRLSLLLADAPNSNGWGVAPGDVFTSERFDSQLRRARIFLCNPPFESFEPKERAYYDNADFCIPKPAELIRRVLLHPPDLLGLVLPITFETGRSYRPFHRQLAENYGSIELVALPEVFNYSDAPTILVLASEKREQNKQVFVTCRTVTKQEKKAFLQIGYEPSAVVAHKDVPADTSVNFSLWIPRLSRVWEYLGKNEQLESVAEAHRGLNWNAKARNTVINVEKAGYRKGVAMVEGHLMQYALIVGQDYLSLREEHQHDTAYKFPWDKPKVVCNRSRLRRRSWRLGAAPDPKGFAFSDRFIALWPKDSISIYALTAVLNSPLASAFVFAHDKERDNRVETLNKMPIPARGVLQIGGRVDVMAEHLCRVIHKVSPVEAKRLTLEVDAEIVRSYDLPPVLERELLDLFEGPERPAPFPFFGYYPPDFDAYIPLHELISPTFEDARADRLLERLTFVNDPIISEAMAMLNAGTIDEGLPS
jgi:hypothetical protein